MNAPDPVHAITALFRDAAVQKPTRDSTTDAITNLFRDASTDVPAEDAERAHAHDSLALHAEVDAVAVLAVDDVATLLRVGRNTVYALVAKNQIPHRRLGKQIRFSRAAVMQWLSWSWRVAKEGK